MNYSYEQAQEVIRCADDIEYFADTYIKVSRPTGVDQIKLNDFQRSVIKNYDEKRIFFMPADRQEGKSTVAMIILLHQALFRDSRVSIIFARNKAWSDYLLGMVYEMYDRLPEFLTSVKITTRNKGRVEFDNLCSIISAGSNIDYGKGRTLSNIYIDESEFFKSTSDVITALYPCIASDANKSTMFALSSTFTGDIFRTLNMGR